MKAYVITTGAVFALLTLAHLLRIIMEWPHLAKEPFFLLITVAAAGLSLWAWRVLRLSKGRTRRSAAGNPGTSRLSSAFSSLGA